MNFSGHHAFLFSGSRVDAELLYNELLQDKTIEVSFFYEKNFTIDTAREIKDIASQTVLKSARYIIAAAYTVGHEAQNALLKTLEELAGSKKLIFFVENHDGLLSTFVSRFSKESSVVPHGVNENANVKADNKTFTIEALLSEVEQIGKAIKDEEMTKSAASRFIDELIVYKKSDIEVVKKLLYFKACLVRPSASIKQLLENAVAIAL
ncbi:MAG: polymerase delta subunit [Candidatus Parcubacteria bacterium]|jgi:hypothetical protein